MGGRATNQEAPVTAEGGTIRVMKTHAPFAWYLLPVWLILGEPKHAKPSHGLQRCTDRFAAIRAEAIVVQVELGEGRVIRDGAAYGRQLTTS